MRSLKRQASAARRYRENEAEHGHLLGAVLLRRWDAVQARLGEVRHRLGELRADDAELAAALHRAEALLAAGREETESLAEEVGRRHSRRAELLATIEGRQEFIKASRQALTRRRRWRSPAVASSPKGSIAELAALRESQSTRDARPGRAARRSRRGEARGGARRRGDGQGARGDARRRDPSRDAARRAARRRTAT